MYKRIMSVFIVIAVLIPLFSYAVCAEAGWKSTYTWFNLGETSVTYSMYSPFSVVSNDGTSYRTLSIGNSSMDFQEDEVLMKYSLNPKASGNSFDYNFDGYPVPYRFNNGTNYDPVRLYAHVEYTMPVIHDSGSKWKSVTSSFLFYSYTGDDSFDTITVSIDNRPYVATLKKIGTISSDNMYWWGYEPSSFDAYRADVSFDIASDTVPDSYTFNLDIILPVYSSYEDFTFDTRFNICYVPQFEVRVTYKLVSVQNSLDDISDEITGIRSDIDRIYGTLDQDRLNQLQDTIDKNKAIAKNNPEKSLADTAYSRLEAVSLGDPFDFDQNYAASSLINPIFEFFTSNGMVMGMISFALTITVFAFLLFGKVR